MIKYTLTTGKIAAPVKCVLYGPEGIGKSTFAAHWPQPVFIDTEGGTKRLDVSRLPAPTSWAMLLDEVAEVSRGDVPCRTLVIDTADWAERLCVRAVCAKAKVSGIEDFGYGKGYVYAKEEFAKLLDALEEVLSSGRNVLVLAHAAITKFEQPDAVGNYDRWQMKTSKHIAPLLREWCDLLLFANYKTVVETVGEGKGAKHKASGSKRVMYTTHHACWDAKNRFELPDEVPFEFSVIAPFVPSDAADPVPAAPGPAPAPEQTITTAPAPAQNVIASTPVPEAVPSSAPPAGSVSPTDKLFSSLMADGVPKNLSSLMAANCITLQTLSDAVFQRGCYPPNTPFNNYDPQFVQGSLVASWDKWLEFIKAMPIPNISNDDLPF